MTNRLDLYQKPGPFGVFKDFVNRAIHGELHMPPWWLRDIGGGNFKAVGKDFLNLFIELANLQPDDHVLDIGCGCGRMAFPLLDYLNESGAYTGIDIKQPAIEWCQANITPRRPTFTFVHADLHNTRYNPTGQYQVTEYTLPFADKQFDFIFLASVFTHLLPPQTTRYLQEIARLLTPDGRAFVTFFLLNETQAQLAAAGKNDIDFKYGEYPYRLRHETIPEDAVAYNEAYLRQLIAECGLSIIDPVHYGHWSGRETDKAYQDILLLQRSQ